MSYCGITGGAAAPARRAACGAPVAPAAHPRVVRAGAAAGSAQPAAAGRTRTFHEGMTLTMYEGNSFAVKFQQTGARVLVDPWLVSDLTFFSPGSSWLYTGRKRVLGGGRVNVAQVAAETDVVLLSQYLDDHTHMPTLEQLPRSLPIIAQPEAAARIAPLGFTNVTTLAPGGAAPAAGGRLRVRGTEGASVGPPWSQRQLGLVIEEVGVPRPSSLYFEPHCDFVESSVAAVGKVDVVVSPVVDVLLGGYALVRGSSDLVKLLKLLQPSVLVPLLNAELNEEGSLTALMSRRGDPAALRGVLDAAGLRGVQLDMPAPPGEAFAIAL